MYFFFTMFNTKEEKAALRARMFQLRNRLEISQKEVYDEWICSALLTIILKNKFNTVHAYLPFLTEINIYPLLKKLLELKIKVVSPKTLPKRKLENRILHSLDELELGIMGTKHPLDAIIYDGPFDLIIVPGLAFDAANFRLGYGGGYYDNFLELYPNALKVGIFYPFQKVDKVPVEAHDCKLDTLLWREF